MRRKNQYTMVKTKLDYLCVLIIFSIAIGCGVKEEANQYEFKELFQVNMSFYPKFMGICPAENNREYIYYADPITRKEIYFKDFNDSLIHSLKIDFVYKQMDEIIAINVINIDSIYLSSRTKALLIDKRGQQLDLINLEKLSPAAYELYAYPQVINPKHARDNHFFFVSHSYSEDFIDSLLHNEGKYKYLKFLKKNELHNYHSLHLSHSKDTIILEFIAKGFYARFSSEPFNLNELSGIYSTGDDRIMISTTFSRYCYIYSIRNQRIIDSIQINSNYEYKQRPILKVKPDNVKQILEPVRYSEFGRLRAIFCNSEKSLYYFILSHGKSMSNLNSILLLDENLKKIGEFNIEYDGFVFGKAIYSNNHGLLIPKLDETKTKLTYHKFSVDFMDL